MKHSLAAQIDDLYHLPLGEFTSTRNALAKTLSGSDKKQIGSLTKPSLPMWVINQLYWQDAPTYRALIDASEKLRTAHRSALSGHKTDTRKPEQLHRTTVDKAFAKAIGIAQKSGVRLTDSVRETVRRTLAALPGDEPAGRLTRPPAPAGFSLLTGIKLRPVAKIRPEADTTDISSDASFERKKKRAEEKAKKEQEARERAIKKAESALRDAERRLAELKR
jgi:hypothetical protein